ncbi:MAG: phenylalanine--tRNA ligase subunit alpha [Flavobacteriales bacterium AspAUS03]
MIENLNQLRKDIEDFQAKSYREIEAFRIKYLGKKGLLVALFEDFKSVSAEEKKSIGQTINTLKSDIRDKIDHAKSRLSKEDMYTSSHQDLTRPGSLSEIGSRHPISIVRNRIVEIFNRIGFTRVEGPEIEDDWHNFTALNLPTHHPARDMQDTFFIEKDPDILLRTHASSMQIRYMESYRPPMRILSPGRVYRNEAISARSHCMFHQIEGLYIDKEVSFSGLKQTIQYFTTSLFGKSQIRLRPSYFPFTEPSAEVDVYWGLGNDTDHRITKGTGWLEIMGCGMVDPQVLQNVGIDPEAFSGFAFGMGIERIALLLYQIDDIRLYFENDFRFLKQFQSAF